MHALSDVTPLLSASPPAGGTVARPLRAKNLTRSLFHIACGLTALALLRLLPSRGWVIATSAVFAACGFTMEIARRRSPAVNARLMRLFAPVAHPHEWTRINSSTWYVTALLALSVLAPLRAAELGVLVLAVADPVAGLVGRRFGRTRLRGNRTLEGSLGFLVAGFLAAAAWLTLVHAVPLRQSAVIAAAGAGAGALAELFSTWLDDNFTIPIAVTAAAAVVQIVS
jgi:dolichol kinase